MKKQPLILTDVMILEWKRSTVDYLKALYGRPLNELEMALMTPGVLVPFFSEKGTKLVRPGLPVNQAYYLRKGLVKLYYYDDNGAEQILYIWNAGSIVVLFKTFREKLPNVEFYIALMEDSELVSVSSLDMDGIYKEHTVAYELTQKILGLKTDRRTLHTRILQMVDKKQRYCKFKKLFPELFWEGVCRLTNEEICNFIGISMATLTISKNES